MNGEVKHSLTR